MEVPLPWERLLWSGRPAFLVRLARLTRLAPSPWPFRRGAAAARYVLTDFRLVSMSGARVDEIALQDIGEVQRVQSRVDRLLGTSTIEVHPRSPASGPSPDVARAFQTRDPILLQGIRRGPQLAALLELLSGEPHAGIDTDAARAAMSWEPRTGSGGALEAVAALAVIVVAVFGVAIGLHGKTTPATFGPDDAIYPNGQKRSRAEIVRFMETEVLPWARQALAPLKGGADRVTCETCHSREAEALDYAMPAVAALPEPLVMERGWERYSRAMDAQMRNAIYGYLAESDNQTKAAYMREFILPGMARLLHRPMYDFARTYDYNRTRAAFGCYHCHRVS